MRSRFRKVRDLKCKFQKSYIKVLTYSKYHFVFLNNFLCTTVLQFYNLSFTMGASINHSRLVRENYASVFHTYLKMNNLRIC
jgi:hypothetical protein